MPRDRWDMQDIDLNLLRALDAILSQGSVTAAAARLGLSISATSRTLARLRIATGDPLFVRAGRDLVPTPRAMELRERVHPLIREVEAVLGPEEAPLDIATLDRTFTLRANEGFISLFASPLLAALEKAAPFVRLRFAPKPLKGAAPLREGMIDLEIGVLGDFAPEVRAQGLFRDRFLGVVRQGHPLLEAAITPERYASCRHVVTSRRGSFEGPVDDALKALGLRRNVVAVVPGFPDALRIAGDLDLVALVPWSCFGVSPAGDLSIAQGLVSFELPVSTPEITVSAMWHPRFHADPAHRWFRTLVINLVRQGGMFD